MAVTLMIIMGLLVPCAGAVTLYPGYGGDDGTSLFRPNDTVLAFEVWDLADIVPGVVSEFGMYFAGDEPVSRIPIFDAADGSESKPKAFLGFGQGVVWDIEDNQLQSVFTPQAGAIGFYLQFNDGLVVYTEDRLNSAGSAVETLPSLAAPQDYLLVFETTAVPDASLAIEAVSGVSPVPVPATLLLMASGLAGVMGMRKARGKGRV